MKARNSAYIFLAGVALIGIGCDIGYSWTCIGIGVGSIILSFFAYMDRIASGR